MYDRFLARRAPPLPHEERAAIACPTTIRRMKNELHILQVCARLIQIPACPLLLGFVIDQYPNGFASCHLLDHLAIDPTDGVDLPGQSVSLWGHPSQVASCRSHSAGIE